MRIERPGYPPEKRYTAAPRDEEEVGPLRREEDGEVAMPVVAVEEWDGGPTLGEYVGDMGEGGGEWFCGGEDVDEDGPTEEQFDAFEVDLGVLPVVDEEDPLGLLDPLE